MMPTNASVPTQC